MKNLIFTITFSLLSVSSFSFDNFQKFLNLREKVYQHKQDGLSEVPILNLIDMNSRAKRMQSAHDELKNFLSDRSKFY